VTPLLSTALLRTQTDERLLRLAAGGHDRAFEAIVERYRRPLLRYVRRLLRDGRAEDVVQAAFVSAWSSLRGGAEVGELRPWLYRIAHNGAVNVLKRAGEPQDQLVDTLDGVAGPEIEVERRDDVRRALHGIADLPSRQRTALLAVAVQGRSHTEVAAELGLSDGALRQLVHRARTRLRAVATILTPPPVAAAAAASHALGADQVAEIATGAGGAGLAAVSLKTGAVLLTAGALVAGAPRVAHEVSGHPRPAAAAQPKAATPAPPATTASAPSGAGRAGVPAYVSSRSSPAPHPGGHAAVPKRGTDAAPRRPGSDAGGEGSDGHAQGGGSASGGSGSGGGEDHRTSATPVADRSGGDGSSSGDASSGGSGTGSPATSSDDTTTTGPTPSPQPVTTSGSGSDDPAPAGGADVLAASSTSPAATTGSDSRSADELPTP
jgi:RNA polymerase sigma factor (sigma-70 family)